MKKYSTQNKCQLKLHWDIIFYSLEWPNFESLTIHTVDEFVGKQEFLCIANGIQNGTALYEEEFSKANKIIDEFILKIYL